MKPAKPSGPVVPNATTEAKPAVTSEDKYAKLAWRQSQKRPNLETLLVSDQLLQDPVARELHEYLKEWRTMRVDKVQYKWSVFNGRVYLQRWSPTKLG